MKMIKREHIKSIIDENQKLKNDLISLQNQQYDFEHRLSQIYSAKSYKLWQKLNNIKKIISKNKNKNYCTNISFYQKNNIDEKISIIIPTRNGGIDFRKNLKSILNQKNVPNKEIIVMDNNSKDGTAEYAKENGCKVYNIREDEFGHGKTRAEGLTKANGKYIIMTVQDANIKNSYTYCNLINFVKNYSLSAASGIQKPKSNADIFAQWQLNYHYGVINPQKTSLIYDGDILSKNFDNLNFLEKRKIICIDDVLACYTKKTLNINSFSRNIEFAEDADIAIKIIKNKEKIGLAYNSVVYHSHNVEPLYIFKRSFIDTITLKKIFNQNLQRINFNKNNKLNIKNKIITIFLLISPLLEPKNKFENFDDLISYVIFNKIKYNQITESIISVYPNINLKKFEMDENICRDINTNIKRIILSYKEFCKTKNQRGDLNKIISSILGGYLAEIVLNTKDIILLSKIKNSLNTRV